MVFGHSPRAEHTGPTSQNGALRLMARLMRHNPGCSDREKRDLMFLDQCFPDCARSSINSLSLTLLLLPQCLPVTLSTQSVGVETVGNCPAWNAGPACSRPSLSVPSSLPPPPIQHYPGAMLGLPTTIPTSYATRGRRMPGNNLGDTKRLPITDLSLAPKATRQPRPRFARDSSDAGGYGLGALVALECESFRAEIPFSALTIHRFTPQTNPLFSGPPSLAIPLG